MAEEANTLAALSDEEYAKLTGLPAMMDAIIDHVMTARGADPLEEIQEWVAQRLREKRRLARTKRSRHRASQEGGPAAGGAAAAVLAHRETQASPGYLPALKTSLFFTTVDHAVATAMTRALDDLTARSTPLKQAGAEAFLELMTAARVVLMTDVDVMFPLLDRDFDYAATNHQLNQVGGNLLKQVTDLRQLMSSHSQVRAMTDWDTLRDGNINTREPVTLDARFVKDLQSFAHAYAAHSVHKAIVVAETFLTLTEEEQRQALRIILSLSIGIGTLLKVVLRELIALQAPYEQIRDFIRTVRTNNEGASYNAVMREAVETSPLHLGLLEGDGLMKPTA